MRKIVLLALLCPFLSRCQPLTLTGQVTTGAGAPLPGATVDVVPAFTTPTSFPDGNATDSTGYFELTGLEPEDTLIFSAPGYATQQLIYSPSMVRYPQLTIRLEKAPPPPAFDSIGALIPAYRTAALLNTTAVEFSLPAAEPLVVLNFVAISCKSCVKDYARLSALQAAYSGRVKLLLVTAEDSARVGAFLRNHPAAKDLGLPIAVSDSVLATWFPHRYLSHTVWLYKGVVSAITDPEYLTAANLDFVLGGGRPRWPLKSDGVKESAASLLGPAATATWYTAFSPHRPGVASLTTEGEDPATASVKTAILNRTILQLYRWAYGLPPDAGVSSIVLPEKDTARFVNRSGAYRLQWEADHTFCYESLLPAGMDSATRRQKLVADLDFYFGLQSSYRKTALPGFALVKKGAATKPLLPKMAEGLMPLSNLVYYLNHQWWGHPVRDDTGLSGRWFIPFNKEAAADPEELNRYLAPYGLALVPRKLTVPALTLTDKKGASSTHLLN